MKKLISLVLALSCLFVFAACVPNGDDPMGGDGTEPDPIVTIPNDTENDTPENPEDSDFGVMPIPGEDAEGVIDYLLISIGEDYNSIRSLTAYPNGDGTIHVEYVGEYKKVGDFDISIESQIIAAIEESGLSALNGENVWEDGEANGSMYVSYKDGSFIGASYGGNLSDEYKKGYEKLDAFFMELVKDLPIYVPKPIIEGNIHEDDLTLINAILDYADYEYIDSYVISEVQNDEFFAFKLGLSDKGGILRGVTFAPMMITDAYSLSMVVLDGSRSVDDVCKDFENNIDWRKWVCVAPSDAMIAVKDNVVICLLGSNPVFTRTVNAIKASGFEVVKNMTNPDMH